MSNCSRPMTEGRLKSASCGSGFRIQAEDPLSGLRDPLEALWGEPVARSGLIRCKRWRDVSELRHDVRPVDPPFENQPGGRHDPMNSAGAGGVGRRCLVGTGRAETSIVDDELTTMSLVPGAQRSFQHASN